MCRIRMTVGAGWNSQLASEVGANRVAGGIAAASEAVTNPRLAENAPQAEVSAPAGEGDGTVSIPAQTPSTIQPGSAISSESVAAGHSQFFGIKTTLGQPGITLLTDVVGIGGPSPQSIEDDDNILKEFFTVPEEIKISAEPTEIPVILTIIEDKDPLWSFQPGEVRPSHSYNNPPYNRSHWQANTHVDEYGNSSLDQFVGQGRAATNPSRSNEREREKVSFAGQAVVRLIEFGQPLKAFHQAFKPPEHAIALRGAPSETPFGFV